MDYIPEKDYMPAKERNRPKWPAYKTKEELPAPSNFRNNVEEYDAPPFYEDLKDCHLKY